MCSKPRTPRATAPQPITMRPLADARSGWRSVRHASAASSTGTTTAPEPTAPRTTATIAAPIGPGSRHHTPPAIDERGTEGGKASAVAAVRRIEVARLGTDRPGSGTDDVGEDHPGAAQESPDSANAARRRARQCARRCGCGAREADGGAAPAAARAASRRCVGGQPESSAGGWGHGSPCSSGYREHPTSLSSHSTWATVSRVEQ